MLLCQPKEREISTECHATVSALKREKSLHRAWCYCVSLEERKGERDIYVWCYCVSLQDIEISQRVWCYCVSHTHTHTHTERERERERERDLHMMLWVSLQDIEIITKSMMLLCQSIRNSNRNL